MSELRVLAITDLVPHPDNPRLQLRKDVVERIAAEIGRFGFGREHALLVRPKDGVYQILSGHHRVESGKRAGLTEVPCWVKDLDDDEAFMQLVLANAQGELSPLEIGIHAAGAKKWHSGSLSQKSYAGRTGFSESYVSRTRTAGEVWFKIKDSFIDEILLDLGDKAIHLYEISKAPRDAWLLLATAMLKKDANGKSWSAADTAHHVGKIREFDIPASEHYWLSLTEVAKRYLGTREFSPRTVAKLLGAVAQTRQWIADNGHEGAADEFEQWLAANCGARSWEPRAIAEYLSRLIAEQFIVQGWHHGDWRDHLAALDDGSVSLLLTDPPYGMGYQSDYRLDRRADRKHDELPGDDIDASAEVQEMLEAFGPKLAEDAHVLVFCGWAGEPEMRDAVEKAGYKLRGSLIWDKQATSMGDPETTFAPRHERILHAVKGSPLLYRRAPDVLSHPRCDSSRHPTEKPVSLLRELIEATTAEGQVVADPFAGVGSAPDAARVAGRRWWGCEIEEKYWRAGEERLS